MIWDMFGRLRKNLFDILTLKGVKKKTMEKVSKIIAVDFDGTLCTNKYPRIGKENGELFEYLKYERSRGAKLILWTCRVGTYLDEAVEWCKERDLYFDAINENLPEMVEEFGSDTRKVFANVYIDDRNMSTIEYSQLEFINAIRRSSELITV